MNDRLIVTDKTRKKFHCHICDMNFTTKQTLERHASSVLHKKNAGVVEKEPHPQDNNSLIDDLKKQILNLTKEKEEAYKRGFADASNNDHDDLKKKFLNLTKEKDDAYKRGLADGSNNNNNKEDFSKHKQTYEATISNLKENLNKSNISYSNLIEKNNVLTAELIKINKAHKKQIEGLKNKHERDMFKPSNTAQYGKIVKELQSKIQSINGELESTLKENRNLKHTNGLLIKSTAMLDKKILANDRVVNVDHKKSRERRTTAHLKSRARHLEKEKNLESHVGTQRNVIIDLENDNRMKRRTIENKDREINHLRKPKRFYYDNDNSDY